MNQKNTLGSKGEQFVAQYLEQQGYYIRHTNWRSGAKEIDIVAQKDEFLVIVEVKSRRHNYLVDPLKAVNKTKQRNLVFAASAYIERFNIDLEVRFDIITVIEYPADRLEIDHIEDAFIANLS